jgi:cell division protein FtsN
MHVMSRAARRTVPPRVPPRRLRGGFMLGLFIGLVLGLGIALGVAFYLNKTPVPFLGKAKPAAKDGKEAPKTVAGMPQGGAKGVDKGADKERPKFDFYKILPGGEEPVSEKELKDLARTAKSQPAQPAQPGQPGQAGQQSQPGQPEAARGVFFIQAGSFQNPVDADNQKAKIALLGFESSVEPTALPDKGTWYRVRLGPYTMLEDLNQVRKVLTQNGIDASLVKLRDAASARDGKGN